VLSKRRQGALHTVSGNDPEKRATLRQVLNDQLRTGMHSYGQKNGTHLIWAYSHLNEARLPTFFARRVTPHSLTS
jgi:hypothetical protein